MKRALLTALALTACASGPAVAPGGTATSGSLRLGLGSSFVLGAFAPRTTCDARPDSSPSLLYGSTGAGVAQLAVTMVDVTDGTVYWIQTGLAATSDHLTEHVLADGAKEWPNSLGEATYDGPCQPHGEKHTFAFTLYALPGAVTLGTDATASVAALLAASTDHVEISATYTRTGSGTPRVGPRRL